MEEQIWWGIIFFGLFGLLVAIGTER